MQPGIYDGISSAAYHGGPGVSKSMLDVLDERSPLHLRAMLDAANDNKPTAAQALGTAFHALLLEPGEFATTYCLALRQSDVPEAVDGRDALVAMIEALNLTRKPKLSTTGSKDELVARIMEATATGDDAEDAARREELANMKTAELKTQIDALNQHREGLLPTSGTIDQLATILRDNGVPVTLWRDVKEEWLRNNGHRIVLDQEDWDRLHAMRDAVMAHPAARALLTAKPGKAEQSVYWIDEKTGVLCRCRPDWWRTDGVIVDVKTTEDASPEGFAKSLANWRYHVQHPSYLDGINAAIEQAGKPDWMQAERARSFVFLAVEKTACVVNGVALGVAVYVLDDESVELGRAIYRRALDNYAQCVATNTWPCYGEKIQPIKLPVWEFTKNAYRLGAA